MRVQQSGECRQATQSSNQILPGTVSTWGLGAPGRSSGIILFASPVDVLEEGHGEGHAQNLKDKGERTMDGSPWAQALPGAPRAAGRM